MKIKKKGHFYLAVFFLILSCGLLGNIVLAGNEKFSYEDIIRLEKVVNKISEFYVEEIPSKDLVTAAIEGLRNILDPHTAYYTEKDYNNLKVNTEGAFGGLGITIAIRDKVLTIISPLVDTPAFRMGLQAGDKIIEIDGKSTKGITVDKAVEKLRGKPGTAVTIKIVREGLIEPLEFTIIRARIQIKSVPFGGMMDNSIGYIKVTQFSKRTEPDLQEKIVELNNAGMKSLILDLRNNPGGLLNQAIKVSNLFLKKKQLVVYTKGRTRSQNKEYFSKNAPLLGKNKKLIILVNEGSASASEIVAGAIQDHDRGVIMGRPTFGKGSVQTILPLDAQKYALKLTTAYYYTPSGRCINKAEFQAGKDNGEEDVEKADTVQKADSSNKFFTDSGRKVYAAGGITPDVDVEGETYNRYIRELERKTLFFKFIIKHRPELEKSVKINKNFSVSDKLRNKFKEFVYTDTNFTKFKGASQILLDDFAETFEKERKALGDTVKSNETEEINKLQKKLNELLATKTKQQFEFNKDYIDFALKRELMQAVLGDSIRILHEISRDTQIKQAVKYLMNQDLYAQALGKKDLAVKSEPPK